MAINILKVLLAHKIHKARKRRERKIYIRSIFKNRNTKGDIQLIKELEQDPEYYHKYFRMNKADFYFILDLVKDKIMKPGNHLRPISALERLALTIRYLATGCSQISLSFAFRISPTSVSLILRECMEAICSSLSNYLTPPTSPEQWKVESEKFKQKWQFPNCVGAIDGKHIRIKAPTKSGSQYYNYKNFFSVVLLAVVSANYEFLLVNIGASGSKSDGGVLQRSGIERHLEGTLPPPTPLSDGTEPLPFVILGDEGFRLGHNLLRPYPGKYLDSAERAFNYRLSRARMVSENGFGILSACWRILHTAIHANLDLVNLIVKTVVILHNFLSRRKSSVVYGDREVNGTIEPGNWREMLANETTISGLAQQGSNNYSTSAAYFRSKFKDYFNLEENKLEWQDSYINRGSY